MICLTKKAPEELEKASSTLPERAILDVRAHGLAVAERVRGALGAGALRDLVPTPERMASAAKAFAVAVTEICGIPLDFSRKSLDDLRDLVWSLDVRHGDLGLLVGFGAYYGETLRATAGAVWMLQPVPFGDAGPGGAIEGTPLADPILPFSDIVATMVGAEEGVGELWGFMRERKKWWLLPVIIVMVVVGTLLVFAQGSALAPFIYTIF